jgi:hypothetical protein
VSEEEDQVRWENAGVYALLELQDGVRIYSGRKEAKSSEGVSSVHAESLGSAAEQDILGQNISKV